MRRCFALFPGRRVAERRPPRVAACLACAIIAMLLVITLLLAITVYSRALAFPILYLPALVSAPNRISVVSTRGTVGPTICRQAPSPVRSQSPGQLAR